MVEVPVRHHDQPDLRGDHAEARERPRERPGLAGHAGVHQHRALAPDEGAARHPEPDRIDPHAHRRAPSRARRRAPAPMALRGFAL